jgi:adenylate cyclase class 2
MLEVEMKFAIECWASLEPRIRALGGVLHETRQEVDGYFNAPDRDYAQTDEALRLRQIGSRNVLTYKGPKLDGATKTRKEIEVPLADGENVARTMRDLLQAIGYSFVRIVRKQRAIYQMESQGLPLEICLDEVEGLGSFLELEIVAPPERADAARTVLHNVAQALGLSHSERRSYLELLLSKSA